MKAILKTPFSISIVVLLSFWAIRPFFVPGFFPMHDDTQPARVYQMAKALSFGQFPVRWVPDLGYGFGYPIFNFYPPLPYYIGGIFNLFGFNLLTSTKLMFIVGILLAGIGMYFLIREWAGETVGIISSVLYMYAPYHAVNIYVRGAVGEFYAYDFLPFLLLGILKIVKKDFKQGIVIASLSLFFILVSHNILGLITGYFLGFSLFIYLLFLLIKRKNLFVICYLLFVILIGIGLSSFFVLPAVVEKKYTKVEELTKRGSNFRNHFVYLDQLWNSPWGYAGSAPGRTDGMSFKIGKLHLILGILALPLIFIFYKRKQITSSLFSVLCSLLLILFISIFLMLKESRFIWEILPGFSYIQYPWRFLNITVFSFVVISSVLFLSFQGMLRAFLGLGIIGLILWFNTKYFVPREYISFSQEEYASRENLSFTISKISDEYMPPDFKPPENYKEIAGSDLFRDGDIEYMKLVGTPVIKEYNINLDKEREVLTNLAFFPGWQAKVDGYPIEVYQNKGLVEFSLPAGKHKLEIVFKDTPIRILSNAISIFSLFLLVYLSLIWRGKSVWQKNIQSK